MTTAEQTTVIGVPKRNTQDVNWKEWIIEGVIRVAGGIDHLHHWPDLPLSLARGDSSLFGYAATPAFWHALVSD